MNLIYLLIIWIVLLLILMFLTRNNVKDIKDSNKLNISDKVLSFKNKKEKKNDENTKENVFQPLVSNPQTEVKSLPNPKKGEIFIAGLEQINNQNKEKVMEVDDLSSQEECISTSCEIEDDTMEIADIPYGNIYEDFFDSTDDDIESGIYFTREMLDEEYNTFSSSEEPWFEHEYVRNIIGNSNSLKNKIKSFNVTQSKF